MHASRLRKWIYRQASVCARTHARTQTPTNMHTCMHTHTCPKLIVIQLVNKMPTFHGTQRFMTIFTQLDTGADTKPDKSCPYPPTQFP